VIALDNLTRNGSELNLPRLKQTNIVFIKGDVRNYDDIDSCGKVDLIIECSAECSVLAGYNSSLKYLIDTNLYGAINCLEVAKKNNSGFIFLSTSRTYPIEKLNSLHLMEKETRFELDLKQDFRGISRKGISEDFSLEGVRSFYGATKLSAELIIQEYISAYGLKGIINRCGVIAGAHQMGKVDQGVVALWVARHIYKQKLSYIGFGGKQVRDVLNINDLCDLVELQLEDIDKYSGETYNVGGGIENSLSLIELTKLCQEVTGEEIDISLVEEIRKADVPYYVTDYSKLNKASGWKPKRNVKKTISDISHWIKENKDVLEEVFQ